MDEVLRSQELVQLQQFFELSALKKDKQEGESALKCKYAMHTCTLWWEQ